MALRILLGLLAGALLGALVAPSAPWLIDYVARPAGQLFMRLLLVLVMPLAATALVLGVAEIKPGAIGPVARRAFALTLGLTAAGVAIGVGLVIAVHPGRGVDRAALPAGDAVAPITGSPVDTFVQMVPDNVVAAAAKGELLGVLIVAVLVGLALRRAASAEPFRAVVQSLFDVLVQGVQMVMWLAPVGVAGLTAAMVAKTGLGGLAPLARFVAVVVGAILVQALVVYPLVLRAVGRRSPVAFYRDVQPALAMAFSTASSAATLPTTLRVAETALRLHPDVSRFVLTVGASANQNGTALFEGVAVLYLAQLYGVDLSLAQQAF
ncbi:MAG: dicarboxylate/amino acid:cation symporter, partial [Deltaproteobacteria bacterium]|nr:dicarboxylate/amino acid:cation symporter [Deltaproteobacteria bacterium]